MYANPLNFYAPEKLCIISDLEKKLEELNSNKKGGSSKLKVGIKKYIIMGTLAIVANALLIIFIKHNIIRYTGLILFPILLLMYLIEKDKLKEKDTVRKNKEEINKRVEENKLLISLDKNKEVLDQVNLKNAQIEILEKSKKAEIDKLEQIENKIKTLKEIEKEKMKNTYRDH